MSVNYKEAWKFCIFLLTGVFNSEVKNIVSAISRLNKNFLGVNKTFIFYNQLSCLEQRLGSTVIWKTKIITKALS